MLAPQDRALLVESLRPPGGYQFDRAVATTFSLDLLALLVAPLSFSVFDWEGGEDEPNPDRMAWLEAIRRNAERIAVFCQVGQIAVPRRQQLLYGYLEGSVFEVSARRRGAVFHPKTWFLRFVAPDAPVRYRLLCLSRNLTFDRSWDTVLALDGEVRERTKAIAANRPLAEFLDALPGLCRRTLPDHTRAGLSQIRDEVLRVAFDLPDGFDSVRFWPLGIRETPTWPFDGRIERLLVVSPFITEAALKRLSAQGEDHVLVSRLDELQQLRPEAYKGYGSVYALSQEADATVGGDDDVAPDEVPATGLHAKLYVANDGWRGRVWTGSANATTHGFDHNVELLVELAGKKSFCGVEAFLSQGTEGQAAFIDLLQRYEPAAPIRDEALEALERKLDDARARVVEAQLTAVASAADGQFRVELRAQAPKIKALPADVAAHVWPITLPEGTSAVEPVLAQGTVATFSSLAFESLTSFFAFSLSARAGKATLSRQFVLNLPLEGAPVDRRERLLRHLLHDRGQVLRFLLYLIGDEDQTGVLPADGTLQGLGTGNGPGFFGQVALFEQLVRALERDPARLDEVERVVRELRSSPDGEALLPEGFADIWEPIWAARQELA